MWKAEVIVRLKKGILDPQGKVVEGSLERLGYKEVRQVRVGKFMEVLLDGGSEAEAAERVKEMARRLLANPVIEDFEVKVSEVRG